MSYQENFYQAVNNKCLNNHKNEISEDYSRRGELMSLNEDNQLEILDEILKKNIKDLDVDEKSLLNLYKKHLKKYENLDKGDYNYYYIKKEFITLKSMLSNIDAKSLGKYISYCVKNLSSRFFDLDSIQDIKDSTKKKLKLSSVDLSLPERSYYFDDKYEDVREQFKNHLKKVSVILKKNRVHVIENFSDLVFNFEKRISKIKMSSSQKIHHNKYYSLVNINNVHLELNNLKSYSEKQQNYDEHERDYQADDKDKENAKELLEQLFNELNIKSIMESNFKLSYGELNNKAYDVIILDGDYFRRIFKELLNSDKYDELVAYFQYKIVCDLYDLTSKELDNEMFNFYKTTLLGIRYLLFNKTRALELINEIMPDALGKLYIKKYFSKESKKQVNEMITELLKVMNKSILNSDWLTEKTKEKAIKKLTKFNIKLCYPDEWKDYSLLEIIESDNVNTIRQKYINFKLKNNLLDKINKNVNRNEWFMSPQSINAYFHNFLIEIVFPAAIIQPPFFYQSLDEVKINDLNFDSYDFNPLIPLNFGGIGTIIAHEITHGFDYNGIQIDENGNLFDWFENEDLELFNKKAELIKKQASQYSFTDSSGKVYYQNPDLTINENLADLGGLSLSLQAMKNYPELCNEGKLKDDVLKLFFMSFANIWKISIHEKTKILYLLINPHAPTDFRVNLVKNFDEFHQVFNVKEGDGMWLSPKDRVKMW